MIFQASRLISKRRSYLHSPDLQERPWPLPNEEQTDPQSDALDHPMLEDCIPSCWPLATEPDQESPNGENLQVQKEHQAKANFATRRLYGDDGTAARQQEESKERERVERLTDPVGSPVEEEGSDVHRMASRPLLLLLRRRLSVELLGSSRRMAGRWPSCI